MLMHSSGKLNGYWEGDTFMVRAEYDRGYFELPLPVESARWLAERIAEGMPATDAGAAAQVVDKADD